MKIKKIAADEPRKLREIANAVKPGNIMGNWPKSGEKFLKIIPLYL